MQENKQRWRELCELAARERDPAKLQELVQEINRLLDEKHKRLTGELAPSKIKPDT
jgi:hypothetical protein